MSQKDFRPIELRLTRPEGTVGFVEYRRAFAVQGIISAPAGKLPEGSRIRIFLEDADGKTVRFSHAEIPNRPFDPRRPDFLCTEETEDPGFARLQAFGFPELTRGTPTADDPSGERDGTAKCWFSDSRFKAVLPSATDPAHGAVRSDGMEMTDEQGNPYDVLPEGLYTLIVRLEKRTPDGQWTGLAETKKDLRIGVRPAQLICRFHPDAHREAISRWADENGYAVIRDPLPGYLDPYAGPWERHMGLLTMYRANDLALFADARTTVRTFLYLMDPASTSVETELAYLQSVRALEEPGRVTFYRYDIGEAELHTQAGVRKGNILPFDGPSAVALCRADIWREGADPEENGFHLERSGRELSDTVTDCARPVLPAGRRIGVMGVIRPWQMDPADFAERPDLTYAIRNAPDCVEYRVCCGRKEICLQKPVGLERFDPESIGQSMFEFYHVFTVPADWAGRRGSVCVRVLDRYGKEAPGGPAAYPLLFGPETGNG